MSDTPNRNDTRQDRREAPVFPELARTSLTFAFEISYERSRLGRELRKLTRRHGNQEDRVAFRLRALVDRLAHDDTPAFDKLVEPVRSFLDDVTTGPPGTNGRPFLFLASAAPENCRTRQVWFQRGESWEYLYEGTTTVLLVPEDRRRIEFCLRDSFCAFDSGRIFYLFTLTQAHEKPQSPAEGLMDEYALLQLQQLALSPDSDATNAECGGFSTEPHGAVLSLVDFAEERLRQIEDEPHGPPNGIRDVIRAYGLATPGFVRKPLDADALHRLCLGIESDALFGVTSCAIDMYDQGRRTDAHRATVTAARAARDSAGATTAEPPTCPVAMMLKSDAEWRDRHAAQDGDVEWHVNKDGATFERPLLAIAGLVQGVPDFPAQDDSEIHDSTRPTANSVESALFIHPSMMIEIAKSWRSYQRGRPKLGTCPYLLLTFLVAVHDELVVSELEKGIGDMIYAPRRSFSLRRWMGAQFARLIRPVFRLFGATRLRFDHARSRPMADVRDVLDRADEMFLTNVGILEQNIRRRLELFRWASIHRSGNIFRYPKETAALAAVRAKSGTETRFKDAHETVDRIESLVEDVSGLRSSYAERRTNTILFILAIMGIVQLPNNLVASMGMQNELADLYRRYLVDPFPINGPVPLDGPWLKPEPSPSPEPQDKRPSKSE